MKITQYIGSQFANPRGVGGMLSTFFMNSLNRKQYHCVKKLFYQYAPSKVLDIGFGNGSLLKQLSKHSTAHFTGIELSADMIQHVSSKLQRKCTNGTLSLLYGNVHQLTVPAYSFDFIYTVNTVYFWENVTTDYEKIYELLHPNGVFVNVFYTKKWMDRLPYTKYGFTTYHPNDLLDKIKTIPFASIALLEVKKNCAYCIIVKK